MTKEIIENVPQDINPVEQSQEGALDDMQTPVFNKIQMQDVVNREKQKAFERGKREALMQMQQEQQEQAPVVQQQQASQGLGGMPASLTPEQIKQMIAEHAPQALQDQIADHKNKMLVDSFVNKMQTAETKYPGLEEQLNKLDYGTLAPIIQMANDMENTGDIMHELVSNPMKMGNLLSLMYAQPTMAHKAMIDLSTSIKSNEAAKAEMAEAKNPMSQIKSSSSVGMDDGSMSIADFKKMFKV